MSDRSRQAIGFVLIAGAALQVWLWSQQVVSGDQLALLEPARAFANDGTLAPFAKRMSGGGKVPGALLPLLVGLPLAVWNDDRAPAILMGLSQWAAVAILASILARRLGPKMTAAYLAVYWLSPWRIYHSGFLWEPGYLLLPAAVHFLCCERLHHERNRAASAGLGAVLACTMQLHGSFLVLLAATAWLAWKRRLRLHVLAATAGAGLGALTLVPTALAWLDGDLPRIAPERDVAMSAPLLAGGNVLKTGAYWLRLGSPDIGRRLRQIADPASAHIDVAPPTAPGPLGAALVRAIAGLALLGVAISAFASWRYLRAPPGGQAAEVRDYSSACLIGALVAAFVSPVPIQGWHLIVVLHAACLPTAAWLVEAFASHSGRRRALGAAFLVVQCAASIAIAIGHPMYAGGGGVP